MKLIFSFLFTLYSGNCIAQDNLIIKYYDSLWLPTVEEKAIYVSKFEKEETLYKCNTYYLPSKKLYGKSYSVDANHGSSIGLVLNYYENGKLKDSIYFSQKGKKSFAISFYESGKGKEITNYFEWGEYETHSFYENGKLWAHCSQKKLAGTYKCEAFDENGNSLPDYVYKKPTEFFGGTAMWSKYLVHNLDASVAKKNGAPFGKYSVKILFVVEKDGTLSNIVAENDPGYGTKEEALRVIKNGPKWTPGIEYNKFIRCATSQVIIFIISD